ncbi:hypothetical protein ABT336_26955 [Micromonospora sp. NPDC000207]|uniref:hypothetical protein n=1 Tax=Micromonospora sp. NPDC000207 TaxID=3154246 RepID=UPI00331C5D4F
MAVTASRRADPAAPTSPLRLYLAVRPTRSILAGTVLLGALTAWVGQVQTPLPSAAQDGSTLVPIWRLIAMAAAILPILALTSPLADLEALATRRLRTMQRRCLASLGTGCALLYLAISATTLPPAVTAVIARSWLAWSGLALLAGACLGWRLAWTLPAATAVTFQYWGTKGSQGYHWWEFSARPYDDPYSLLLSLTLLTAGLTAYAATPWRRHHWRRHLHPGSR